MQALFPILDAFVMQPGWSISQYTLVGDKHHCQVLLQQILCLLGQPIWIEPCICIRVSVISDQEMQK